jgi:SAM-dependent MidA family methyltransferase
MAGATMPWREAMTAALYGPEGFYTRPGPPRGGGGHFRTSAHASALFANAILRVVAAVDEALDRPDPLTVVDVGAGGAHLLRRLAELAPTYLDHRLRLTAVELGPAPEGLPERIEWRTALPGPRSVLGVVLATEWLDNVPIDVAVADSDGVMRYTLVDPETGAESPGEPLSPADQAWLERWWPGGTRVELGGPRDAAWTEAVGCLLAGTAVTVDYGHLRSSRPAAGTLTGFFAGHSAPTIPDGSADITAHVAIDAICAAGAAASGQGALLLTQQEALTRLGVDGSRPPIDLAHRDPQAYIRGLSGATQAAELTDPSGLGGHFWIVQPVGLPLAALPFGWAD